MKIEINKNILFDALQLIVNISTRTSSEPILNNVLIDATDPDGQGLIIVKATNYDISFSGLFEANIITPGKICLTTIKLFNLVREFSDEKIYIETNPQNWVIIKNCNSKIILPGLEAEQFPVIEFKKLKNTVKIPREILIDSIDKTYFAIGENESRRNLMGLNLFFLDNDKICWQGADAFRISYLITPIEPTENITGNIIIPKKSLVEIKRILEFQPDEIMISFDENTFQVSTDKIKFKTRLIEASYPNLKNIVDSKTPLELYIPKRELIHSLRILYRVSDENQDSVVKIILNDGKIVLQIQKLEKGEGDDVIFCDYQGDSLSIGINIKFFLECLQVFDSAPDDNIKMKLLDSLSPLIFQTDKWNYFKTILMPVKIKW